MFSPKTKYEAHRRSKRKRGEANNLRRHRGGSERAQDGRTFPSKHRIRIVALDVEGDSCQLARSAITVENVSRMIGPRPLSRAVLTLRRTSLSSSAPRAPRSSFLPRPSTLRRLARRRNYEKKKRDPKVEPKEMGKSKTRGRKTRPTRRRFPTEHLGC